MKSLDFQMSPIYLFNEFEFNLFAYGVRYI